MPNCPASKLGRVTAVALPSYRGGMTKGATRPPDRRIQRTQRAIFDALRHLLFERRYDAIRTADLIDAAGIGRSTFYEHFRSKDEVLVAMIDPVFVPMADALTGRGSREDLVRVLDHIWEQRAAARAMFEPPLLDRLQRKLAALILARMPTTPGSLPVIAFATGAACAHLAVLRMWLTGEISMSPAKLADGLFQSTLAAAGAPMSRDSGLT